MKKVLFVVDERKIGGVSTLLESILNNLDYTKLDVTLVILKNTGEALNNLNKNVKVIYDTSTFDVIDESFLYLIKRFKFRKALKKMILSLDIKLGTIEKKIIKERKKLNISGFDTEIAFKSGFCSLFVGYGDSKYKINWVHEDYKTYNMTKKYEKRFKKVFSFFDLHIVVSKSALNSFNEIYHMENKSQVVLNYIDESRLNSLKELPSNFVIDKSKTNIVTLGRFVREKGLDRLVLAVNELAKKNKSILKNARIYILGTGNSSSLLKSIKRYNLEEYIQVIDTSTLNNNPYSFMKKCDYFYLTSRSESFAMTRIEAMLLGLFVVSTDVANEDNLFSLNNMYIVNNDVSGIVTGLEKILQGEFERKLKSIKSTNTFSYTQKNNEILEKIMNILEE